MSRWVPLTLSSRLLRVFVLAAGLLLTVPASDAAKSLSTESVAPARNRVALVIGNATYSGSADLKNPVNDATDMAERLSELGFDVTLKTDIQLRQMLRTLTEFGDKVKEGSEALFFYAGHGMQVKGRNYLIPIDAQIRTESSVSSEAVDVDQLLDKLSQARLSMVILDACRNNPFERRFRSGGQGLAQINAPTGTLIAYATAPGKVAADGDGRNGLYTQELLKAMDVPGIKIEDVFKRVRGNVVRISNDAQTPWESSSLTGDFYFSLQVPATVNVQHAIADPETDTWKAAESANTELAYRAYLQAYPKGRYAVAARIKFDALKRPAAAPEPEKAETDTWNEVKKSGTREYFDAYLQQYPKGKYVVLAKVELKKLDEKDKVQKAKEEADRKAELAQIEAERKAAAEREKHEAMRNEEEAWARAKAADTVTAYSGYLGSHPKGRYATLALVARQKAQGEEAEAEIQASAQREREAREAERRRLPAAEKDAAVRAKQEEAQPAEQAGKILPGKVFKDCADCPEMVIIPAGSFIMGSPASDAERFDDEGPQHRVTILNAFAIGKYEVTVGQWKAVMGNNPNPFSTCGDDCPVEQVIWDEATEFVRKLTQRTGKNYRLPSEAEWEYACRSGGTPTYCGGENLDNVAWYDSNSSSKSHTVGSKQPNAWGLFDMSGNAWEWVEDCWNGDYIGAPSDGSVWARGDCGKRVLRGGSWDGRRRTARSSSRYGIIATNRYVNFGFRLARTLPLAESGASTAVPGVRGNIHGAQE